jgi:hypothetical protein
MFEMYSAFYEPRRVVMRLENLLILLSFTYDDNDSPLFEFRM